MYAAGLTLLDAMLLQCSYDVIDCEEWRDKEALVEDKLLSLKPSYQSGILLLVRKMLETLEEDRITFIAILKLLQPHTSQIRALRKVDFDFKKLLVGETKPATRIFGNRQSTESKETKEVKQPKAFKGLKASQLPPRMQSPLP